MLAGILAGLTWAIDTVILGVALSMTSFTSTAQAAVLAPFVSTFLHDFFAALTATIYNGVRGKLPDVWKALKSKSGRGIVIAAIIGAPVGMTGYVMAVNYMGASVGAVATAIFPAIGAVLAVIFLKEKMQWYRWVFLVVTLIGVYGLSYSPDVSVTNFGLGILGAAMCLGVGLYAPCMALCVLIGLHTGMAFPIMMGSCAFLMAFGNGPKFIMEGRYDVIACWTQAIGGAIGVYLAYYVVKSMNLKTLTLLVVIVCFITGILYMKDAIADTKR